MNLDFSFTSGYENLDLTIKKFYEDVWRKIKEISEINMKYYFGLKMIIEPNEFYDLYDVREYLLQNMFNEEQPILKSQINLDYFHKDLHSKLTNIIKEIEKIVKPKENDIIEPKITIKNNVNDEIEKLQTNFKVNIEETQYKTDMKIKMIEIENEKLKAQNSEYYKKVKFFTSELEFQNTKLINVRNYLAQLMTEKNNLIKTIKQMEIKEEGFQTLQTRCKKEQEENERLKNIISQAYENTKS